MKKKELMNRWTIRVFLLAIFLNFTASCSVFADSEVPYVVSGKMTMEESALYEVAGLDFSFLNKTDKAVRSFTLVFYFFDEDGNVPSVGSNSVVLEIIDRVGGGKLVEDCVSLDKYLYEIPESPYLLDYMYVSKIVYEDGSEWTDPFGMYAFS